MLKCRASSGVFEHRPIPGSFTSDCRSQKPFCRCDPPVWTTKSSFLLLHKQENVFSWAQNLEVEGVLPEFEESWRVHVAGDATDGVENSARNL